MNDESAPKRPRHRRSQPPSTVPRRPARVTGLQLIQVETATRLATWREHLSPREYAVALDLVARIVDAEIRRNELAQKRWAA